MGTRIISVVAVFALLLTACVSEKPAADSGAITRNNTLIIATPELFLSRDPLVGGTTTSSDINIQCYEFPIFFKFAQGDVTGGKALVQQGDTWEPKLAEKVDINATGTVFTFHLRKGIKFYPSGNEMTAKDWLYSFDRTLQSPTGFGKSYAAQIAYSKPGRIIDEYTYELTLDSASPAFYYMATVDGAIMDSAEAKKNSTPEDPWSTKWLDKNTVGSGPYYQKSASDSEVVLEANPNYWGTKPYFKRIVYRYVPAVADRVLLLKSGDVDIAYRLPQRELSDLTKTSGVKVLSAPSLNLDVVFMNTASGPTADQNVRKAILNAIPYDDIISNVFSGRAKKFDSILYEESLGYVKSTTTTTDVTKAKAFLQQSKYPTGFSADMLVRADNEENKQEATLIKDALGKIGINVNIVSLASGDYSAGAKNYPLILRTDHPWLTEGIHILVSYVLTNSTFNYSQLKIPELDQLFKQAFTADKTVRKSVYEKMQQLWFAQDPMAIMAKADQSWAMRSNIVNFTIHEPQMPVWSLASRSN